MKRRDASIGRGLTNYLDTVPKALVADDGPDVRHVMTFLDCRFCELTGGLQQPRMSLKCQPGSLCRYREKAKTNQIIESINRQKKPDFCLSIHGLCERFSVMHPGNCRDNCKPQAMIAACMGTSSLSTVEAIK